jgi:hypothetical protein
MSDPNVSDKQARSASNCMVLHPACQDDPVEFYNLHGFWPDNLRRKWGTPIARRGRAANIHHPGGAPGPISGSSSSVGAGWPPMSPPVGLGFEPDADDEDEDHLIKSLITHVYKTLGSIALRTHESNLRGTQQLHPVFRVAFLDH